MFVHLFRCIRFCCFLLSVSVVFFFKVSLVSVLDVLLFLNDESFDFVKTNEYPSTIIIAMTIIMTIAYLTYLKI